MRNPPSHSAPEPAKRNTNQISMTREYRLLTPLYGGGVKAGVVDTYIPIRGAEVRGQLRFWWRATRGAFGQGQQGLASLKAREDEIWGSTQTDSKVVLSVEIVDRGKRFQATKPSGELVDVGDPQSRFGYVAFPLSSGDGEPGWVQTGVAFNLWLRFPADLEEDVRAALWAWDTFGGIGARTRRGFGALSCLSVSSEQPLTGAWRWFYKCDGLDAIGQHARQFVSEKDFHQHVPHLGPDDTLMRFTDRRDDPIDAWEILIKAYKKFRQSRKSNAAGRPYGRSKWPEPDEIRAVTGNALVHGGRNHTNPIHYPSVSKFPRGAFGLPIIFEFKDDAKKHPEYSSPDPAKTELKPQAFDRFASPLILRPLACDPDKYVGLALVLAGPRVTDIPGGLELKGISGYSPDTSLDASEARTISKEHPTLNNHTDVLRAFLDTL